MYTFTIDVSTSPQAVFDELAHVERHPTWANPKAQLRMEQVTGDGPGADARYRSSGVFINKQVSADISVTTFELGRRFAIRSDQHQPGKKDQWFENSFVLEAAGGGTRVTKSTTGNGNPIVGFLARPAIKKDAMTSLGNLKLLLESRG